MLVQRQVDLKCIIVLLTEVCSIKSGRKDGLLGLGIVIAVVIVLISNPFLKIPERKIGSPDLEVRANDLDIKQINLDNVKGHVVNSGGEFKDAMGMIAKVLSRLGALGDVLQLEPDLGLVVKTTARNAANTERDRL